MFCCSLQICTTFKEWYKHCLKIRTPQRGEKREISATCSLSFRTGSSSGNRPPPTLCGAGNSCASCILTCSGPILNPQGLPGWEGNRVSCLVSPRPLFWDCRTSGFVCEWSRSPFINEKPYWKHLFGLPQRRGSREGRGSQSSLEVPGSSLKSNDKQLAC